MAHPGDAETFDHDALHRYLWRHADKHGNVRIFSGELAEVLGLRADTTSRLLWEMELSGRMKRVSPRNAKERIWRVRDPQEWRWTDPAWALRNKWR